MLDILGYHRCGVVNVEVGSKKVIAVIKRRCAVCGKEITIKVFEDYTYEGGHYFGNLKDVMKEVGLYDPNAEDWEYEYWECPSCYNK